MGIPQKRISVRTKSPTVGAWCETSTDFDLLVELIAHALADEETSTIQVAHHQSVARQKCKLAADFGIQMHLAWAQHLLDNREFVKMEGRFPSSDPRPGQDDVAYASDEEERDLYLSCVKINSPIRLPRKSEIVMVTGKGRFLKEAGVTWDKILGGLAVSPGAWIAVVGRGVAQLWRCRIRVTEGAS